MNPWRNIIFKCVCVCVCVCVCSGWWRSRPAGSGTRWRLIWIWLIRGTCSWSERWTTATPAWRRSTRAGSGQTLRFILDCSCWSEASSFSSQLGLIDMSEIFHLMFLFKFCSLIQNLVCPVTRKRKLKNHKITCCLVLERWIFWLLLEINDYLAQIWDVTLVPILDIVYQ